MDCSGHAPHDVGAGGGGLESIIRAVFQTCGVPTLGWGGASWRGSRESGSTSKKSMLMKVQKWIEASILHEPRPEPLFETLLKEPVNPYLNPRLMWCLELSLIPLRKYLFKTWLSLLFKPLHLHLGPWRVHLVGDVDVGPCPTCCLCRAEHPV